MNVVANNKGNQERQGMKRLCQLIRERSLAAIIIPSQDRLSRKPLCRTVFERECHHYGVRLVYGDAPSPN